MTDTAQVSAILPRPSMVLAATIDSPLIFVNVPTPVYYSLDQYIDAFLDLLPSGRIWDKEPGSNLYNAVAALMPTFAALSASATNVLIDTSVGSTQQLLNEWELSLGLPDPCLGVAPSIDERRNQCIARFAGSQSLSIPFYSAYAAQIGFPITVTEYLPFYADLATADTPLAGENAAFIWRVQTSAASSWLFQADVDTADMPLGGFGSTVLECEITRLAPAHTQVWFF